MDRGGESVSQTTKNYSEKLLHDNIKIQSKIQNKLIKSHNYNSLGYLKIYEKDKEKKLCPN